jgi:hypothetical protein
MSTSHENIRLDTMAHELEGIKGEVSEMKVMVKDIHVLLTGNPIDKTSGGLILEIKEMKGELDDIKKELTKYKAFFYALITLVTIGGLKVIIDFLTHK